MTNPNRILVARIAAGDVDTLPSFVASAYLENARAFIDAMAGHDVPTAKVPSRTGNARVATMAELIDPASLGVPGLLFTSRPDCHFRPEIPCSDPGQPIPDPDCEFSSTLQFLQAEEIARAIAAPEPLDTFAYLAEDISRSYACSHGYGCGPDGPPPPLPGFWHLSSGSAGTSAVTPTMQLIAGADTEEAWRYFEKKTRK